MATMVLGGLWHGAAWTFVAWGTFHGALLYVNHTWRFMRPAAPLTESQIWRNRILVFLAVVVGWVIFRADNIQSAAGVLRGMVALNGWGPIDRWLVIQLAGVLATVWWLPNTQEIFAKYQPALSTFGKAWQAGWLRWSPQIMPRVATSVLLALSILSLGKVSPFLYFRF